MDQATIVRLNALNQAFYHATAASFDETRGPPWSGWARILDYISTTPHAPVSILDAGCGNGRFGLFLADNLSRPDTIDSSSLNSALSTQYSVLLHYHGLDSNPTLLNIARRKLAERPLVTIQLEERDIVERPPESVAYDLVALFGVLHHIPGAQQRLDFMRRLAERVKPGGLLAFACWRFYEYARFRERIVPWPDDWQVEPHDYLLDWRRGNVGDAPLRYCHYVDDTEHAQLVAATGLTEIATYRADGFTGDVNRYSLLKRA